jgi:hypothetical protein
LKESLPCTAAILHFQEKFDQKSEDNKKPIKTALKLEPIPAIETSQLITPQRKISGRYVTNTTMPNSPVSLAQKA